MIKKIIFTFLILNLSLLKASDNIIAVGSSTVYQFSSLLAENFHKKNPQYKTPVVEAIGTGGGAKVFCGPINLNSPDILNASRQIKDGEIKTCQANHIKNIVEIHFGYDALAIVSPKSLNNMNLTIKDLFLATAMYVPDAKGDLIANPYTSWNEINHNLPHMPIKIIGPSPASGTRDSFIDLVLAKHCAYLIQTNELQNIPNIMKKCSLIRSGSTWINGGENFVLTIKKVNNSKDMLAILGYNFYQQNKKFVNAVKINSFEPNDVTFASKSYPLFRPLYMYVNMDNMKNKRGLKEFIKEIISNDAIGKNGYLVKFGLIPLGEPEYNDLIKRINIK